jgi:hydroxymethylglutaryl-CoA lyase
MAELISSTDQFKIIECPRDAMQGIHDFIPTAKKAEYINRLLQCGFSAIDFGSFVSPKSIPQMRDTAEVLSLLDLNESTSPLLAIVANQRGAEEACRHEAISFLGFPFSVSETFQLRNTNATIEKSLDTVNAIRQLCATHNKQLVVYISMAFGNPYGDAWNADLVLNRISKIVGCGVEIISLADTVGIASPVDVGAVFKSVSTAFPEVETGVHLHCRPDNWREKVQAAYLNGCRRFDAALKGFGGCPMANDELVGNLATESLMDFCQSNKIETGIHKFRFNEALKFATDFFSLKYA